MATNRPGRAGGVGDATEGAAEKVEDAMDRGTREAAPWLEKLARLGYAAKGAVYLLVGGLAVFAATGNGGDTTGSTGAMASIADSTVGRGILALIALGLAGYVIWSLVRAIRDPEDEGAAHRIFFVVAALIHAFLAVEAARLAFSGASGGSGGDSGASHWSAQAMQQPFGQWLAGAVGVGIALYGVHQLINAWQVDLDDQLALGRMSRSARTWAVRTGRFGLAARGAVFSIIGYFVVQAALQADAGDARGVDAVLSSMRDTPLLLGVVALGLVAYGVYNLIRARFRVIRPAQ